MDAAEYLSEKETNLVQRVCVTFFHYTIAIDSTILPSIGDISSEQYKATKNTAKYLAKLLNYNVSNPHAKIQYRANGLQLAINSEASYLSVSTARSRASGIHFLSEGPPNPNNTEDFVPTVNGIFLVVCKIMRNIVVSAAEDEYGTILVNPQKAVPIRTTLTEILCQQRPTSIQVENSTTVGIATKDYLQNTFKAMDMRFFWINARIKQGRF